MTMSAADFLDQWFETDPLKATMAASGIIGTYQGVRSPGHRVRPAPPLHGRDRRRLPGLGHPEGRDRRRVATRSRSAARALGAEIRTEAPVARIIVRDGRATGVVLESGEEIEADATSCRSVDSRRTFLGLARAGHARARRSRRRSAASSSAARRARSTSRSTGCPTSRACPARASTSAARSRFSPSIDDMERAYDDAKYGHFSREAVHRHDHPDPRRSVDGAARQARHQLLRPVRAVQARAGARDAGTTSARRSATRSSTGSPSSPRTSATSSSTATSRRRSTSSGRPGLTEGNIFQGELSLEQLFFNRPVPGYARFRTPVRDLWLCGSATHPGGGIMGANGRIAALEVLRARGRKAA